VGSPQLPKAYEGLEMDPRRYDDFIVRVFFHKKYSFLGIFYSKLFALVTCF